MKDRIRSDYNGKNLSYSNRSEAMSIEDLILKEENKKSVEKLKAKRLKWIKNQAIDFGTNKQNPK